MNFLSGKKILILGVASKLSIASGIAAAMHKAGAGICIHLPKRKTERSSHRFKRRSIPIKVYPCDVTDDKQISELFSKLSDHWDALDGIVHCLAFAPAHELNGNYVDVTTREGFHNCA